MSYKEFYWYYPLKPSVKSHKRSRQTKYVIYSEFSRQCIGCNLKVFNDDKGKLVDIYCEHCDKKHTGKIKRLDVCSCAKTGRGENYLGQYNNNLGIEDRGYYCFECNNQGFYYN